MTKKRRSTGLRRKKSNKTMNKDQHHQDGGGAKRSKTVISDDGKNRLAAAIKAMIDSMDEEHLYSMMEYAGKVGKELMGSTKQAAADTSAAKATATTTTTTTEIAGAKTTTTMTTGGTTTNVSPPRTPQETTQEATPPPIQFNKNTRPSTDTLVKIVPRCFHFGRTDRAADDFRRNKVLLLVNAIVKNDMSLEQQALVLQQAIMHPLVKAIAKSAGLVDNNDFMVKNYVVKNMKNSLIQAQKTNSLKGRSNDDLRAFVQSVVLSSMPSTNQQVEEKENGLFKASSNQIAETLGVQKLKYYRIRKENQSKRDLLELRSEMNDGISLTAGTIFSQVVKRKGWTKVNKDLEEKVYSFIENHPNVVQSPMMNDYVRVKDKSDPSVVHKLPKLLLQVSIRELHNDLLEQVPEASKDGVPLVSDTKLREMMPPQVKKMTERYKEICGCSDCVSIGYLHSDNNIFTSTFITDLKNKRDSHLPGSRSWSNGNEQLTKFLDEYERKDRPKDALKLLQCQPCDEAFPDLINYSCAKGTCQCCPKMSPHSALMSSNKLIWFHAYEVVTTCTKHGVLSAESNGCCAHCDNKREGELIGKLYKKRQLVVKKTKYKEFFNEYYMPALLKYRWHRFHMMILSKRHTGNDRQRIEYGEVHSLQDFAERLTLRFNNEIQTEHFGGSCTVSLEGIAVRFFTANASRHSSPVMELFTFLSDAKVQDSSVVNYNMDKLLQHLKAKGVMKPGDYLLTNSDGCAAQYRCSTAFFFLTSLAISHGIAIDRAISCPGHGKDIVDGINGTTKTELSFASANQLKTAAELDGSGVDTKKFAAAVMQGNKGCSAALECKRILEFQGTSGKKSNRKYQKRENSRGIQRMHYWVRGGMKH